MPEPDDFITPEWLESQGWVNDGWDCHSLKIRSRDAEGFWVRIDYYNDASVGVRVLDNSRGYYKEAAHSIHSRHELLYLIELVRARYCKPFMEKAHGTRTEAT